MIYTHYASDILEAAMELAQTKALNSYSFRDCMNWLTELWQYCYERMAQIDEGFYSRVERLTQKRTHLPPYVKNTVKVFRTRDLEDANRMPYRQASMTDMNTSNVFLISGNDLYCRDAEIAPIWVEYIPEPPLVTFTKNNRDPEIVTTAPAVPSASQIYGPYQMTYATGTRTWTATSRFDATKKYDVTPMLTDNGLYYLVSTIYDYPYVFFTCREMNTSKVATGDYIPFIIKDLLGSCERTRYNPFDYQGRPSSIEILDAKFNDYTGMGVTVKDYNDSNKMKKLGWTPDTKMDYPAPVVRNYLVSHLAARLAESNSSQLMVIQSAVTSSEYQMANFFGKNKSAWFRIERTTGRSWGDIL
jgi:hypothetical protein